MKEDLFREYLGQSKDSTIIAGMMIADGLTLVADALYRLGTGNAHTGDWGAIEAHTKVVEDAASALVGSLRDIASSIDAT